MSGNPHMVLKLCLGTYFRHPCPFMALRPSSWLCKFIYIKITSIPQNLLTENCEISLLLILFKTKTLVASVYLVCNCIDIGPCIIDGQFGDLPVGLPDDIEVPLIILVPLAAHSHQGLTAAHDDSLGLWVHPRENLATWQTHSRGNSS